MAYATITPKALIEKFQYALDNHWGYILNTNGKMWTQKDQDALNKTTSKEMENGRKYGAKWIGHYVTDCSGLFYWSFKKLSSYMYHGSNTMYRSYCVNKGVFVNGKRSDGQTLKPGTALFTGTDADRGHVGLYIGDGWVIEAQGTKAGVVKSKSSLAKWTWWGELKYVDYSNTAPVTPVTPDKPVDPVVPVTPTTYPTLRQGAEGDLVVQMQSMLARLGSTLTVDGIFGSGTRSAVMAFQRRYGLEQDGICGPKTWAKLLQEAANINFDPTPSQPVKTYTVTIKYLTEAKAKEIISKYGGEMS